MDGDTNDIFQKLNSFLDNPEMADNLKNIINNISSSDKNNPEDSTLNDESDAKNRTYSTSNNARFPDFDIETILKLKNILDTLNNSENDSRSNLLLSLKPYVADSKKQKIDQYIKFLNLAKVAQVINPLGGDTNKNE